MVRVKKTPITPEILLEILHVKQIAHKAKEAARKRDNRVLLSPAQQAASREIHATQERQRLQRASVEHQATSREIHATQERQRLHRASVEQQATHCVAQATSKRRQRLRANAARFLVDPGQLQEDRDAALRKKQQRALDGKFKAPSTIEEMNIAFWAQGDTYTAGE